VEEELARGLGLVILAVALGVFVNVDIVKKDLVILDAGEGIGDLAPAGAEGFDFGAVEDETGLEGFEDVEIAAGLGVVENVGHRNKKPEASFW